MKNILDGKTLSNTLILEIAKQAEQFHSEYRRKPKLSVIFAGNSDASSVYVSNKDKACRKAGIDFELIRFDDNTSTHDILDVIDRLNHDDGIDGILVQLPLPESVHESEIIAAVSPEKDADGFHPFNIGKLWTGDYTIAPCTPFGVICLLEFYGFPFTGARAVIIGRSNIVGKPMAALLLERHCTVTITHSRTRDLPSICRDADLIVAAIGRPAFITDKHIGPGAWIVDVGINRITRESAPASLLADESPCARALKEKGHCLVGDVDPNAVAKAAYFTPVPGGVGPMTIAMLISNTMALAKRRMSIHR